MSGQHVDLERAIESNWAKGVNRFLVPVLIALLGTVCGLLLQDIRSGLTDVQSTQVKQGNEVVQLRGDVQLINSKIDQGVLWRISELERRLNTVEQAQKTP